MVENLTATVFMVFCFQGQNLAAATIVAFVPP